MEPWWTRSERKDSDAAESTPATAEADKAPAASGIESAVFRRKLARRRAEARTKDAPGAASSAGGGDEGNVAAGGLSGEPMALPFRGEMEASLGAASPSVEAHGGPEAAAASQGLGAQAYAVGDRVAFKDPNPSKHLVAHELAHAVDQRVRRAARPRCSVLAAAAVIRSRPRPSGAGMKGMVTDWPQMPMSLALIYEISGVYRKVKNTRKNRLNFGTS